MHLIELIEKNTIAVIDLETTGFDYLHDYIIDVSVVKIGGWNKIKLSNGKETPAHGNIIGQFSSYIFCPVTIPHNIVKLTGITDTKLKDAPQIDAVLKELKKFIGDDIVVGHNIKFNYDFLHAHGDRYGINFNNRKLDTIAIAKTIYRDKISSYSLSSLTERLHIPQLPRHTLNSALATAQLFCELALRDDYAHCNY